MRHQCDGLNGGTTPTTCNAWPAGAAWRELVASRCETSTPGRWQVPYKWPACAHHVPGIAPAGALAGWPATAERQNLDVGRQGQIVKSSTLDSLGGPSPGQTAAQWQAIDQVQGYGLLCITSVACCALALPALY